MEQAFSQLGRAFGVRASCHCLTRRFDEFCLADRAVHRKFELRLLTCPPLADDLDNLWDYFTALFDKDPVAPHDAQTFHFLRIVHTRARDSRPREQHWFKYGDRCNCSCAADRIDTVEQLCGGLAGREFIGNRPTRGFGCRAQFFLNGDLIDFDDDSVNLVIEIVALILPLFAEGHYSIDISTVLSMRINLEAMFGHPFQRFEMGVEGRSTIEKQLVAEDIEFALCHLSSIELTHGSRCGV